MANEKLFAKLVGKFIKQYRVFKPRLVTLREPQYHLKQLMGIGSYGGVFRADQVKGDRFEKEVAIKLVEVNRNDPTQLNELEALVSFSHPNLLKAYLVGDWQFGDDEFLFVVMPLAECSLQDKINKNKLPVSEVKQMVIESAQGLHHLHSQGKIHRDFKPLNLLKENGIWKIADFGLIRDMKGEDYIRSNTVGTFVYMPPEPFQAGGVTSPAWDIWSLGISIIQSFTQAFPYRFQNRAELIGQVTDGNVIIPSNLPSPFDQIVKGCLIKDRKHRWTAQRVLETLNPQPIGFYPPMPDKFRREIFVPASRQILNLPKNLKLELVNIPSGTLIMEGGHEIRIDGFRMSKYAITQAQYEAVMGENPSHFTGNLQCPVENVLWDEAVSFCHKLSQHTGQQVQVRLPSESEWEYACRAETSTKYYFGDNTKDLKDYAWYWENSERKTHPVGEKRPNNWGLYDMHGNIFEWCADQWIEDEKKLPKDGRAFIDNNDRQRIHASRGGSWYFNDLFCYSAFRNRDLDYKRSSTLGFRVVI